MLGRFLEFSVQTGDIIDSLGFYKLLGFHEIEIGDVLQHKYAVVSDGDRVRAGFGHRVLHETWAWAATGVPP